jgi:hypothetical protein
MSSASLLKSVHLPNLHALKIECGSHTALDTLATWDLPSLRRISSSICFDNLRPPYHFFESLGPNLKALEISTYSTEATAEFWTYKMDLDSILESRSSINERTVSCAHLDQSSVPPHSKLQRVLLYCFGKDMLWGNGYQDTFMRQFETAMLAVYEEYAGQFGVVRLLDFEYQDVSQ